MSNSIINTGTNTKIITTNNVNKIEVTNENIIESDSEFREVVKKGYLLSQINLTTIPDIIQNAINEAMLDTKEQTLADALIETLRLSISNLDDGVYKKTYIDNTISYIENLVVSKVSPETVAAIADSKLAIALEGFATTASVSTLSSRVGNSEVEISNVKQTINTKDTARALQIEQMEARVNDTFAGYSEAIDLYVDAEGNVKSEKIEKLEANNSMATVSINEENKISLDAQGNYVAFVAKFIADSDGKIVGYNFSDTNDLTTFTINADVFKISNSDNSYTPFTIDGNNILFNGKMTFANVTGTDGIVTTTNMQTVFNSEITAIDGGKITTNSIDANKINTVGLIAENISADEIVGKTLVGAVINGAVINGAVVRASYLDLDGELEVLTNYHITPAMYAANPSLYIDAVYIEATNEYRIPSTSNLIVGYQDYTLATGQVATCADIRSYNCANVGHNRKAVKISPTFNNSSKIFISSYMAIEPNTYPATWQKFHFRCGAEILFTVEFSNSVYTMNSQSVSTAIITSPYFATVNLSCSTHEDDGVHAVIVNNVPFLGATEFKVTSTVNPLGEYGSFNCGYGECFVKILDATSTPTYAWNNPDSMLNVYCEYTHNYVYEQPPIKVNFNGIKINNMI